MVRVSSGKDSPQEVGTPQDLFDAVNKNFNFRWDLASTKELAKCEYYFGPDHEFATHRDSLEVDWTSLKGPLWLNPPHGNITPFYEKCRKNQIKNGPLIVSLVPLDQADWYLHNAHGNVVQWNVGRIKYNGYKWSTSRDQVIHIWDLKYSGVNKIWKWKEDKFY